MRVPNNIRDFENLVFRRLAVRAVAGPSGQPEKRLLRALRNRILPFGEFPVATGAGGSTGAQRAVVEGEV